MFLLTFSVFTCTFDTFYLMMLLIEEGHLGGGTPAWSVTWTRFRVIYGLRLHLRRWRVTTITNGDTHLTRRWGVSIINGVETLLRRWGVTIINGFFRLHALTIGQN